MIYNIQQSFIVYFILSLIEAVELNKNKLEISLKNSIEIYPLDKKIIETNIEDSPFYHALKQTFTKDQLLIILHEFVWIDILGGIKNSLNSSVGALKAIWWAVTNPIEALNRGYLFVKKIPSMLQDIWLALKNMSLKELLKCVAQIGVFALFAYLGFSVPDLDIPLFGIGQHRNFMTHSVGPAILFSLLVKLGIRFMNRIQENYPIENEWIAFIQSILKTSQIGFTVGIASHLAKDLLYDGSQTIRGLGPRSTIPDFLRKNYRFDDGYLAANILASVENLPRNSKVAA